jgi:hypothetical protein
VRGPTKTHRMPVAVSRAAEAHRLGLLLRVHQPSLSLPGVLGQILVGLALVLLGLIRALFLYFDWSHHLGMSVAYVALAFVLTGTGCVTLWYVLLGILAVSGGLSTIESRLRGTVERIYECSEGFVVQTARGRVSEVTRWEEIGALSHEAAYDRIRRTWEHTFWITKGKKGAKYPIRSTQLWKRIEEEFTQRHLQQALEAYQAGQPVNFGELSVNQHGVTVHMLPGEILPWHSIARVRVTENKLVIEGGERPSAPRLRIPLAQTCNTALLEQLLHEVSAGRIVCVGLHET